ncbi:hypothetical protein ACQPZJ_46735 [Actinoplanes sp. CA-054009]
MRTLVAMVAVVVSGSFLLLLNAYRLAWFLPVVTGRWVLACGLTVAAAGCLVAVWVRRSWLWAAGAAALLLISYPVLAGL